MFQMGDFDGSNASKKRKLVIAHPQTISVRGRLHLLLHHALLAVSLRRLHMVHLLCFTLM